MGQVITNAGDLNFDRRYCGGFKFSPTDNMNIDVNPNVTTEGSHSVLDDTSLFATVTLYILHIPYT